MIQNVSDKLGSDSYFKVQHISVSCLCQKLQIKVQKSFLINFTEFVRKELIKMAYQMWFMNARFSTPFGHFRAKLYKMYQIIWVQTVILRYSKKIFLGKSSWSKKKSIKTQSLICLKSQMDTFICQIKIDFKVYWSCKIPKYTQPNGDIPR